MAKLSSQSLLAWSLPESARWPVTRLLGRIEVATHAKRTRRGPIATRNASTICAPGARAAGSRQSTSLGAEHVSAALDKGRGIIFWAGNFSFNDLIAKIAWRRLGLAVSHFSRPIHGFSTTRFGVRYLNAVRRGIEDRYLGERLMAEEHETQAALMRLREHLKTNGAISITVGNKGRHTAASKFPRRTYRACHRPPRHGADDRRRGVAGVHLAPCAWQVRSHDRRARRSEGRRRRQA